MNRYHWWEEDGLFHLLSLTLLLFLGFALWTPAATGLSI